MNGSVSRVAKQERLANALSRMVRATELSLESAARQGKLHPTDLRCLALLSSSGRQMTAKEIVSGLGLTSGSGTALFDRLERHGYIRRVANPDDRRGVLIEVDSDQAEGPLRVLGDLRSRYRNITKRYSDEELDLISSYLEAVSQLTPSSEIL